MQPVADAAASASADVDVRQHESTLSATTSTASVALSSAPEEETPLAILNYDGLNLNHEEDKISNESAFPDSTSVFDTPKGSTSATQLLNQNSTTSSTMSPPAGIESIAVEEGRPPNPTSSMNARENKPDNMKEQPTDELLLASMMNDKVEQPADLLTQTASTVMSSSSRQWEDSTLVTTTSMSSSSQTIDVASEQSPVTGLATLLMPAIGRELIDKDEEPSLLFGTTAQTAEDVAYTSTSTSTLASPTDAYRSNSPAPPPPAEDFEHDISAIDLATSRLYEIERLMNESFNPYPSSNSKLEIIDDDDVAQDMLRPPSLMNGEDDDNLLSKNSKLEIIVDDDNVQYMMFRSPWVEGNGSDTHLTRKMKRSIIFGDNTSTEVPRRSGKENEDEFATTRIGKSDGIVIVGHRVDDADESRINPMHLIVEGSDDVATTAAVAHLSDADERNATVLIPEAFLVEEDLVEERRTEQVFVTTYLKPHLPWWKQRHFQLILGAMALIMAMFAVAMYYFARLANARNGPITSSTQAKVQPIPSVSPTLWEPSGQLTLLGSSSKPPTSGQTTKPSVWTCRFPSSIPSSEPTESLSVSPSASLIIIPSTTELSMFTANSSQRPTDNNVVVPVPEPAPNPNPNPSPNNPNPSPQQPTTTTTTSASTHGDNGNNGDDGDNSGKDEDDDEEEEVEEEEEEEEEVEDDEGGADKDEDNDDDN